MQAKLKTNSNQKQKKAIFKEYKEWIESCTLRKDAD